MKVVSAGFEILNPFDMFISTDEYMLGLQKHVERIGRTCYKSENRIESDSYKRFIQSLVDSGHESVLEHSSISVRFTCDRGISHELVRHRIASFSQESTRYCNYSKDKFGNEITVIKPFFFGDEDSPLYQSWLMGVEESEHAYFLLLAKGATPQEARSVLPNSLKTEIVATMNLREWRHFFKLRALDLAGKAHPQMKEITVPLLAEFQRYMPEVFDFSKDMNKK